jgi:flagellar hook-basal body complex protein FliE
MIESISASTAVGSQTSVGLSSASSKVTATAPSEDFGEVLGRLVNDAVGVVQAGEDTAIQGIKGAASPLAVVNSVMVAQQTLHSALAIRDKVVSAYQEIARMTI